MYNLSCRKWNVDHNSHDLIMKDSGVAKSSSKLPLKKGNLSLK